MKMPKIKDIPKVDRPRERLIKKGPQALSESDLLSILLGSGIKGKNVQHVSRQVMKKFGKNFLNVTIEDLQTIPGIGQAKALQIISAISLVKKFCADSRGHDVVIKNSSDITSLVYDLRDKKKEHLVCLYLNGRNALIKKETISVGILDKTLLHPREVFYPATELNAARVVLVHNHPSGDTSPSRKDMEIVKKISQAGEIMGISVLDFVIISEEGTYSFYEKLANQNKINTLDYVSDGVQNSLFDLLEIEHPTYDIRAKQAQQTYFHTPQIKEHHFQLNNRRYIGNKYKLIEWIFSILDKECHGKTFADVFSGTGVVTAVACKHYDEVILNDHLYSNYAIYKAFFGRAEWSSDKIMNIIKDYNNINGEDLSENYFSINFGGKFFSNNSAKIIGLIRDNIDSNKDNLTDREYYILIASLLYSVDKIANTVGHYDAYFKKESVQDRFFMRPIDTIDSNNVSIYRDDVNLLVKQIKADVMYIDPPYNSRQYSRFYHLLETLTKWDKPVLHGVALKPVPENMSDYCRVSAKNRFAELIHDAKARYLVVSYNNTYDPKSRSSQNRITLGEIKRIMKTRGATKVFEKSYRYFNAGNTDFNNHKEYLFVTEVSDE